ncbi:MAG: hypothetical protein JNM89_16070 [Hyphomicrobiaceae bacterium]|nr:hypothetical protein [Hyphomicrobiaceae bacterium]
MTASAIHVHDGSASLAAAGADLAQGAGWFGWLWPRRPTRTPEAPMLTPACHRRMTRLYGNGHLLAEFDGATGP